MRKRGGGREGEGTWERDSRERQTAGKYMNLEPS